LTVVYFDGRLVDFFMVGCLTGWINGCTCSSVVRGLGGWRVGRLEGWVVVYLDSWMVCSRLYGWLAL
jgi:hypothetical protein